MDDLRYKAEMLLQRIYRIYRNDLKCTTADDILKCATAEEINLYYHWFFEVRM